MTGSPQTDGTKTRIYANPDELGFVPRSAGQVENHFSGRANLKLVMERGMAKVFERIDDGLQAWINKQHLFFVSTAPLAGDGLVNCSPKGYDSFRILNDHQVAYLDLTGSGIETVAHLQENGRIVFMFCSFEQTPRIVRLHGRGTVHEVGTREFDALMQNFHPRPGMRSIIRATITRVSDSCGYGVPRYEYLGDRATLVDYWDNKGAEGTAEYHRTRNAASLEGLQGIRAAEKAVMCD